MTKNRCSTNTLVLSLAIGALLICAATAQAVAAAGPVSSRVTASVRSVQPAVSGLFQVKAPRVWNNGVPAFLYTWDAFQSRTSSAIMNKAYAFTTIDGLAHEILYAGVERASSKSPVVFEFSQLEGERSVGDLRIEVEIDNAGSIGTVQFQSYGDGGKAGLKLLPIAILAGEGCSDSGTACVVANGASLEVGANLSQLLSASGRFKAAKITAPEGSVVGTFDATPGGCIEEVKGLNKASCTANDVALTDLVEGETIILDDGCTSPTDTVTFTFKGIYTLTTQERFDIGVYIATDGDTGQNPAADTADVGDGARGGFCARDVLIVPSNFSSDGDACGDIDAAHTPLTATNAQGPVTIQCVDNTGPLGVPDGKVDLIHCETWKQPGNNEVCNGSADAAVGTGSKCNCGTLPSFCIAVPDDDPCTTDVCQGTCSNDATKTCQDTTDCTPPGRCTNIVLVHTSIVCENQDDTDCDNPDTCVDGACQPNYEPSTTKCRNSACDVTLASCCDVPEFCDGAGNCPADGFATDAHECRAKVGDCDAAEHCDGTKAACPIDGVVPADPPTECRRAFNECDIHETCDGISKLCPTDFCGPSQERPTPFCSTG